jgi:hypothetical protein
MLTIRVTGLRWCTGCELLLIRNAAPSSSRLQVQNSTATNIYGSAIATAFSTTKKVRMQRHLPELASYKTGVKFRYQRWAGRSNPAFEALNECPRFL